jgi:cell fate regulator YaaT (PSP1 superfamily)
MGKIVDVQISKHGKVQSFDSGDLALERGDPVLVETELGAAMGVVSACPRHGSKDSAERSLPKVKRLANMQDLEVYEHHMRLEGEIYSFCYERIREKSLPMNLVSVDRLFDGSKVMVYFTSEGRVDFRELVKELVQRFRTRIEMRQIGVRHQAKMVGGLGNCGRQICCTGFLTNFDPVSIKMAKEQNLSLNPSKISGMCGRLMCCLSYEYGYYEEAKKGIPKVGKKIKTVHGEGKIIRQNVLTRRLTVLLESGNEQEVSYDEIVRDAPPQGGSRDPKKNREGAQGRSQKPPQSDAGSATGDRSHGSEGQKEKDRS